MRWRGDERCLLLGALALLPLAQMAVRFLPLPKLIRLFDLRTAAPACQGISLAEHLAAATTMRKIFRVIDRKFFFWPGKCLAQALVARFFLRRRLVPCLLILGAKQSRNQSREQSGDEALPPLRAHAWLKTGDVVVTGDGSTDYIPVAFFI